MQEQSKDVVIDIQNEFVGQGASLRVHARKAILAGLGAAAFAADEMSAVVDKMAARGEDAKGELRSMLDECRAKLRRLPEEGLRVSDSFGEGVEAFANRFNGSNRQEIASLHDQIRELNAKIATLVDERTDK